MVSVSRQLGVDRQEALRLPWPLGLPPIGLVFLAVVCVAVAALLYLSQAARVATSGYDLARLEHEIGELNRDRQRLIIELAIAEGIGQIDKVASNHLGMINAREEMFLSPLTLPVVLDIEEIMSEDDSLDHNHATRDRLGRFLEILQEKTQSIHGINRDEMAVGSARTSR